MHTFFTESRRKWLYNIAIAVLAILAGYGFIGMAETENYTRLIEAFLNVGGLVAVTVARANVTPDKSQEEITDAAITQRG